MGVATFLLAAAPLFRQRGWGARLPKSHAESQPAGRPNRVDSVYHFDYLGGISRVGVEL